MLTRSLLARKTVFFAILGLIWTGSAFVGQIAKAEKSTEAYHSARRHYYQLMDDAKRKQFRHHWVNLLGRFQRLVEHYPDSAEAPKAQYTAAELWRKLHHISRRPSDLDEALAAYGRVAEHYSTTTLADDALWQRAQIYLSSRKPQQAATELARLLQHYPDGDMAAKAKARRREIPTAVSGAVAKTVVQTAQVVAPSGTTSARVDGVEHGEHGSHTRVVIALSAPCEARSHHLPTTRSDNAAAPDRIVVDLATAHVPSSVPKVQKLEASRVKRIRVAQFDPTSVRVVLDLSAAADYQLSTLKNPDRVVIDVRTRSGRAQHHANRRGTSWKPHIVLDPGHGGKDVGARSKNGLREKDVVLRVAEMARKRLVGHGARVTMTRTDDTFVPLDERTAIANRVQADAFVSIHCNAHGNAKAHGIETYYLNVAHDRYALRLAAVENQTSEKKISDLQLILADLSTKANTQESMLFARRIQKKLVGAARRINPGARDLGVKGSLFYVLLGARMPSILAELSFLSNPTERKLLARKDYQRAMAHALADAVWEQVNDIERLLVAEKASGP